MKKFIFLLYGMMLCAGGAKADLYQVSGIPVAAELSSANEAREVALANGQTEAFWQLMRKMTTPSELQKVPVLSQDEVVNLVQNVSVSNEKTTDTKYMATISVRFKPKETQDFLTQNQVPFLIQAPPPYVVIPVFKKGEKVELLEEDNPVFIFLKQMENNNPLFEVNVPTGDGEDVVLVQELWDVGAEEGWEPLLKKYGAERVFFFALEQLGPSVTVRTWTIPADKEALERQEFQVIVPSGDVAPDLPRMWRKSLAQIETAWRRARTNDLTTPSMFWVSVPIETIQEWQSIYTDLLKSGFLNGVEVRAFRPRQVLAALRYKGAGEQLDAALRSIGMRVRPLPGSGAWELVRVPVETEGVFVE